MVTHVFHQIDKTTKIMLTMTSAIAYAAAPFESGPATSVLINKARKFVKNITRQPCLQNTVVIATLVWFSVSVLMCTVCRYYVVDVSAGRLIGGSTCSDVGISGC